ncbi:26S proteasome non-ATPase regulatory subunit 4, partial [Tanacetum coccineum]
MCGTYGGKLMKAQTNAYQLYFSEKLKARPDNTVGFTTMGALYLGCEPCRDPKEFWSTFDCLVLGGYLQYLIVFVYANYCLQSSSLPIKRLAIFAGGQLTTSFPRLEYFATLLRKVNITAVDVVNFGIQDHNRSGRKNTLLQAFVAAVNNGRYLYAPTGSHKSLAENLSRSLIMPRVDGEGS